MYWTCNSMNNLLSYSGLVDAEISASEKELPVPGNSWTIICPTSPNLRLYFIKIVHRKTLLKGLWVVLPLDSSVVILQLWYVTGKKNSFTELLWPALRLPTACILLGPGCSSPGPLYYSGLERDNEGTSPPRSVIWDINTERLPQRLSHSIGCLLAHGPHLG